MGECSQRPRLVACWLSNIRTSSRIRDTGKCLTSFTSTAPGVPRRETVCALSGQSRATRAHRTT